MTFVGVVPVDAYITAWSTSIRMTLTSGIDLAVEVGDGVDWQAVDWIEETDPGTYTCLHDVFETPTVWRVTALSTKLNPIGSGRPLAWPQNGAVS